LVGVTKKVKILDKLKRQVLIYDGAMGTMLLQKGLEPGNCPEQWNLDQKEKIFDIHNAYVSARADVIETNTFGANPIALKKFGLEEKCYEINYNAVEIAKKTKAYVAAAIGPLPLMTSPLGELSFNNTLGVFKEQIKPLSDARPDILLFETFSDIKELKIAIIAAKEICDIPIQAQLTYSDDCKTISGTSPEVAVCVLESLGVNVIGANCSLGPKELYPVIKRIAKAANKDTFISVLPNAGLPEIINNKTCYKTTPKEFINQSLKFYNLGVNLIGGCCGTDPDHINELSKKLKNKKPIKRKNVKKFLTVASRTNILELNQKETPYIIGERINPSRRKILTEELKLGKTKLVRQEAIDQVKNKAMLLDVNVSAAEVDEVNAMDRVINAIQQVVSVPLVIDSTNPQVIEKALQECVGRPVVNSVNGEEDKLNEILPLIKKYGASVVALTMDDNGIPMIASKRIKIAKTIIKKASILGIKKEDIIFDLLTLAIATNKKSAKITLNCIKEARKNKWQTLLGVSNVSFGLPNRTEINNTFLALAVRNGLTAAIINPRTVNIKINKEAKNILLGKKLPYIILQKKQRDKIKEKKDVNINEAIYQSILTGDKDNISEYVEEAINQKQDPYIISKSILIPALEEVGKKFEKKEYFLPQLLLAAESMQSAIKILDKHLPKGNKKDEGKVLIATVKGDLHDIGKNIVISVFKNYGYSVIDLGKDVSSDLIIETAVAEKVDIIGLSSLMTTTMGQMELVIRKLKETGFDIPTLIGGAVVTSGFAKKIGAAGYANDAIGAVSELKRILNK